MEHEQRRHPRVEASLRVMCRLEADPTGGEIPCRSVNIAAGGILLTTGTPIDAATNVILAIHLTNPNWKIETRATVVRTSPQDDRYALGVRFEGPANIERRALAAFVATESARLAAARAPRTG